MPGHVLWISSANKAIVMAKKAVGFNIVQFQAILEPNRSTNNLFKLKYTYINRGLVKINPQQLVLFCIHTRFSKRKQC